MEINKVMEILEEQYPKCSADTEDFIGLQVKGDKKINGILITLDITLDVINQCISKKANMIISHHPLFFGNKEEILLKNPLTKSKYDLLKKLGINVFIIHTNADFNHESISWAMNIGLGYSKIEQLDSNKGTKSILDNPETIEEITSKIKKTFELNYDFRTNIIPGSVFRNVVIGSGASGDLIFNKNSINSLLIVGELKYHEWIYANENDISVLEIGHFSENIFKVMVKDILITKNVETKIETSKEENAYRRT